MAKRKKPGVDPTLPGYLTVGRLRKYQLDPRWDEMTSDQRAYAEDLGSDEEREEYMDQLGGDDDTVLAREEYEEFDDEM
jgi:hypothetical protein